MLNSMSIYVFEISSTGIWHLERCLPGAGSRFLRLLPPQMVPTSWLKLASVSADQSRSLSLPKERWAVVVAVLVILSFHSWLVNPWPTTTFIITTTQVLFLSHPLSFLPSSVTTTRLQDHTRLVHFSHLMRCREGGREGGSRSINLVLFFIFSFQLQFHDLSAIIQKKFATFAIPDTHKSLPTWKEILTKNTTNYQPTTL